MSDVIGRAFLRYWPISTFGILQTPTYPDVREPAGTPAPSSDPTSSRQPPDPRIEPTP